MPKPAARRATACPMRPKPTIPSVAPCTSWPEVRVDTPAVPTRRCAGRFGIRRAPGGGQQEQEGEVGGGLVEHARGVAHRDRRAVRRRGDVDVVVADTDVADDPKPTRAAADNGLVDRVGDGADDGVEISCCCDDFGVRQRLGRQPLRLVSGRDERAQPVIRQRPGEKDAGHAVSVGPAERNPGCRR